VIRGLVHAATLALAASGPALADMVKTPECQRDLAAANVLIEAVAVREKQFVAGDLAKNCRLLRQNLADMIQAREPMDRCVTGHDHGEDLGQMDASIGDIRALLADKCQK
jgi:hypothetical protein